MGGTARGRRPPVPVGTGIDEGAIVVASGNRVEGSHISLRITTLTCPRNGSLFRKRREPPAFRADVVSCVRAVRIRTNRSRRSCTIVIIPAIIRITAQYRRSGRVRVKAGIRRYRIVGRYIGIRRGYCCSWCEL